MERITDAIIDGLRLCETSYQNHVKEMGKVTERDVQAWGIALKGLTPDQIRNAFLEHIQAKNYWPKPADIRGGVRFTRDRWDPVKALPSPPPRSQINDKQKARIQSLKSEILSDPKIAELERKRRRHENKGRLRTKADRNELFNPMKFKGDPENVLKSLISTVQNSPDPREEERIVASIS